MAHDISILDNAIRRVPDFPTPGTLFYDITGILADPAAFSFALEKSREIYRPKVESGAVNAIAAVESRGFLFAPTLAQAFSLPLILIRKKGKLPGDVFRMGYSLEYGTAEIEVHKADVKAGQRFLLIDDLIATGGTLDASKKLIALGGAEVTEIFGIIGLPELNYKNVLAPTPVTTLIDFAGT